MLTREDIERREDVSLAPYAVRSGCSRGRVHDEPEHPFRTVYQRDRDRVIHSTAFRRLEYKTQVFIIHEGDHYRTRLTHTLEVAQIARTLARSLNLNEDLTEAVALGHDLGHTPFGHSGEAALNEFMKECGGFEHNLHGLRVVDVLEHPYPGFRGLNLSYEVRESIAKHHTVHDSPQRNKEFPGAHPPLEGQVVEVADRIAYDSHDLDDSLAMDLVQAEELVELDLFKQAAEDFARDVSGLTPDQKVRRVAKLLIDMLVRDALSVAADELAACGAASPDDVRSAPGRLMHFSDDLETKVREVERFLMDRVYRNHRVMRMTLKAQRFLTRMMEAYEKDVRQLPPTYQRYAEEFGTKRAVCDYVAGMTDRFAQDEYRKLFEPFERL
ncbi:MAG TPA: deoxyguanosinetriphosphate triphosphohydrolase [Phycisphaerae bacterium]|nr:deoxyguanosinetriphosphate triphosphohydrolase [Phycisphaerae bacterium]